MTTPITRKREPAELRWADALQALRERDRDAKKPPGWQLAPRSVVEFVCDGRFIGDVRLVERCVATLVSGRPLLLLGDPGTGKSMLSELLAAAVCGCSTLTVQGAASTTEDQIRYGWNYARLLAEGPTRGALVPGPVWRAMERAAIARIEEITRCPLEVGDALLSILSEWMVTVPELSPPDDVLYAQPGMNLIATANSRDRGVNEMSAALKRRFNFEVVHPIADAEAERRLVEREAKAQLAAVGMGEELPAPLLDLLVTSFRELRSGQTAEGQTLDLMTTPLSTAEAINVAVATAIDAQVHGGGADAGLLLENLAGTVVKSEQQDRHRFEHYLGEVLRRREGRHWQALHHAWLARCRS